MEATVLRQVFLEYMRVHGHAIIGSAPLIPEHDPSVLFTTAGMHPLVHYDAYEKELRPGVELAVQSLDE